MRTDNDSGNPVKNTLKKKKKRINLDPLALLLPFCLLALWTAAAHWQFLPSYLLPHPIDTMRSLVDFAVGDSPGMYSGKLWIHLQTSLLRVGLGLFIASAAGLLLGYVSGRNPVANRIVSPFVHLVRAVPGIGWLPLAIVWFGVGEKNTLFLISLASFFPIYTNAVFSSATVDPQLLLAGKMMGVKGLRLFWAVILPASFPGTAVGLRLGLGISWAYLVLGEMTGVNSGLGAVMTDARLLGRIDMVIVCILVISVAAKITDFLLKCLCRLLTGGEEI